MKTSFKQTIFHFINSIRFYIGSTFKWLLLSVITGVICGVIGYLFHHGVEIATEQRTLHPWLLWLLPAAGLIIVGLYKITKMEGMGTNDVIDVISRGKPLSIWLLPAIFVGTILTHLCGGSSGREGAALQMGGTIGFHVGRLFDADNKDIRTATMVGMAAFFSALFGTPLAATMFSIMVISVGVFYHSAFFPCLTGALTAFFVSTGLGSEPTHFMVRAPEIVPEMFLRIAVLAIGCGLVAILFCNAVHKSESIMKRLFANPFLRIAIGGFAVIGLTYLCNTTDYNGAGMNVITAAIEEGTAHPFAFLLKILFTAITLGAGFKGGEVVPSFFIGATFGCVVGPLLGIPSGFAAAIGLVCVFCGATNCPVSSIFLSIELFGASGLMYFAVACGLSYIFSGYNGLYSSQTILYSKLKAKYINASTNHFDEAEEQNK